VPKLVFWLIHTVLTANAAELGSTSFHGTLEPGYCYTWSINPRLALPLGKGQIITEAYLTLHNIHAEITEPNATGSVPRSTIRPKSVTETAYYNALHLYVLGNLRHGFWPLSSSTQDNDPFARFGSVLAGDYQQGDLVYRLSRTHDPNAWTAKAFGDPMSLTLANGASTTMSSSLLEFIDYAGTGCNVGFGIRSGDNRYYYDDMTLTVTVESYEGDYTTKTIVCHIADGPSPDNPYTLAIAAVNGSVAVSPEAPAYGAGQAVMLTAAASVGYTFSGWSGDLTGTANPITTIMNRNQSIKANFKESSRSVLRGG